MTTVLGPVVHAGTRNSRTASLRALVAASIRAHDLVWPHAFAYVVVNTTLVVSWFLVAAGRAFWPGVVLVGWGVRLASHAATTFSDGRVRPTPAMGMGGPPAQSATPVGQGEDDGAGTGDPGDTSDDSSDDGDD